MEPEAPQAVCNFEDLHKFLASSIPLKVLREVLTINESWPAPCVIEWLHEESQSAALGESYQKRCSRCLSSLVKKHLVFPSSFFCNDIERDGDHPLGGGGFADVFKGIACGQTVCLKVLRVHTQSDEMKRKKMIEDFCQEALIWTQLDHPNVLKLLGVNTRLFKTDFCLVSPWMENGDIVTFLGKRPNHDRLQSIQEIVAGLEYLHSHSPMIVHGDIKGANVLVDDSYSCRLADFGLSREALGTKLVETSTGGMKGSTRWMAPEMFEGSSKYSIADRTPRDIYAYACTILEIMTGKPPFSDLTSDLAVIRQVYFNGARPPRPTEALWCPDNVWELVEQCWHQDPLKRPTANDICTYLMALTMSRDSAASSNQHSHDQTTTILVGYSPSGENELVPVIDSAVSDVTIHSEAVEEAQPSLHENRSLLSPSQQSPAHSMNLPSPNDAQPLPLAHPARKPGPGTLLQRTRSTISDVPRVSSFQRLPSTNHLRALDKTKTSESNETGTGILHYSLSELVPLDHLSQRAGPLLDAYIQILQAKLPGSKLSVNPATGALYCEIPDNQANPSNRRIGIGNETSIFNLLNEGVVVRYWSQLRVNKAAHRLVLDVLAARQCQRETIKHSLDCHLDGPGIYSSLTNSLIAIRIPSGKDFKVVGKHCIGKGKPMEGNSGKMRAKLQNSCRRIRVVAGSRRQTDSCWISPTAWWLSQAWYIFQSHGISLEEDPSTYKLIDGKLELSGTLQKSKIKRQRRQRCPPIYLFTESSSTYFWSFDENGETQLLQDSCKYFGLPYKLSIRFTPARSYSFPNQAFRSVYEWQVNNGFDPHTTDFAKYLGHALFKVVLEDSRFEELEEGES